MAYRFITDGKLDRASAAQALEEFLRLLVKQMRLDVQFEIRQQEPDSSNVESPEIIAEFRGRDAELLTERNGELLKAIEYIAHRCLRLDPHAYERVLLECGDVRALRLEELRLAAQVAADRVRETRQPFRFNPMSPRERRIVHLVLKDAAGVRTASEGVGDHRQVVVYPAEQR